MRVLMAVAFVVSLVPFVPGIPSRAADAPAPAGAVADATISGHWTGAKLRCQKEEGKMVRCGTPAPFEITFAADGTGSTQDENLPKQFRWRWLAEKEIAITPDAGGDERKLFAVDHEDSDILSFQAYVFLPTDDPNEPAGVRYIHYVFDVSRAE